MTKITPRSVPSSPERRAFSVKDPSPLDQTIEELSCSLFNVGGQAEQRPRLEKKFEQGAISQSAFRSKGTYGSSSPDPSSSRRRKDKSDFLNKLDCSNLPTQEAFSLSACIRD
ncbi:hypothetical protein Lal_00002321 [Lupinus albus]|nr:hypothetical protein Lal_00002321 [Lupinus albus]